MRIKKLEGLVDKCRARWLTSGKPSIYLVADAASNYPFVEVMSKISLFKRLAVISGIFAASILAVSCGGGRDADFRSPLPASSDLLRINALDQDVVVPEEWKTEVQSDPSARNLEYLYFTDQQGQKDSIQEIFVVGYYDSNAYESLDSRENSTFNLTDSRQVFMADANSMELRIYESEVGQMPDKIYLIALEAHIIMGDYVMRVFAFGEKRERAILEDFVTRAINSLHVPNSVDLELALDAGSVGLPEYLGVSQLSISNIEFLNGDQAEFEVPDLWQHKAIDGDGLNIHTFSSPLSSPTDFSESLVLVQMSHSDFINDKHASKLSELGIDYSSIRGGIRRMILDNGIGRIFSEKSFNLFEFYGPSTDENQDNLDSQTLVYRIGNQIYLANISLHKQNYKPLRHFAKHFEESFVLTSRSIVSTETSWTMPIGGYLEFAFDPDNKLLWISDNRNKTVYRVDAYTGEVLSKRVFDVYTNEIYFDSVRNELAVQLTPSTHAAATVKFGSGLLAILDATSLDDKLIFDSGYEPQQWVQLTNGDIISNTVEVTIHPISRQYEPYYRTNYISRKQERITTSIEGLFLPNLILDSTQTVAFAVNNGNGSSMLTQELDANGDGRLLTNPIPVEFSYDAGPFWSIDGGKKIISSSGESISTLSLNNTQSNLPARFTENSIDDFKEFKNLNKAISLERFSGTEAVSNLTPDALVLSVYDSQELIRLQDYILTEQATGLLVGNEKIYLLDHFHLDRGFGIRVDVVDKVSNGF